MMHPIETLESRTLLSTTITIVPGPTLVVRGTNASELITLSVRLASDRTKILRAVVGPKLTNYDLTNVRQIQIESLDGNDTIIVDKNTVRGMLINGGVGNDSVNAGNGNDTVIGGRGNDIIVGNNGDDQFKGYDGADTIAGNDGNDVLDGGNGDDFLQGGDGNDTLVGDQGRDQLFGQDEDDRIFARDDRQDIINGGDGDDSAQTDAFDVSSSISVLIA